MQCSDQAQPISRSKLENCATRPGKLACWNQVATPGHGDREAHGQCHILYQSRFRCQSLSHQDRSYLCVTQVHPVTAIAHCSFRPSQQAIPQLPMMPATDLHLHQIPPWRLKVRDPLWMTVISTTHGTIEPFSAAPSAAETQPIVTNSEGADEHQGELNGPPDHPGPPNS